MNTKPIIFSGPMVRAILDGTKTQTRRIIKNNPYVVDYDICMDTPTGSKKLGKSKAIYDSKNKFPVSCPYWKPGDTLWVRETFAFHPCSGDLFFRADGDPYGAMSGWKWKASIFMPRALSRITLQIESVRVERLHEISEADAKAEGVNWKNYVFAVEAFQELWQSINGISSWNENPFVWVITFKRIKP